LKKLFTIFFLLFTATAFATHNRAGEITFSHVSGLTYEITVTTYTKDSSPADRPSLGIYWGDSSPLDSIDRVSKILLGNDINQNIYIGQHTYPGPSPTPYLIRIEDPNRNAGIENIPQSVNIVFYLETELLINPFQGVNNSPVLLNPPIDNACVNQIYIHNPGAVDPDGDSLYYTLDVSRAQGGVNVPGYFLPPSSNFLTINNFTGDLIWNTPMTQGEFNIAIRITEYRNGKKIGSILRDMQITVVAGCNPPPIITTVNDTCIIAGDLLNFTVNATGSHPVTLSATGIPFNVTNFATFNQTTAPATITSGVFNWQTDCSNIRNSNYFVSFKATDAGAFNLADYKTTIIRVIGPKVENLTTNVQPNSINLTWDKTICSNASAYKVYRKKGPSGWSPGICETGIPANVGFQLIATINNINDTTFNDDNNGLGLIAGEDFCYRIVTYFPDRSESIASDEICDQLKKDVPIITNVSVNSTSTTIGDMDVEWSKPTEFDTVLFPGPYRYLIYRGRQTNTNLTLIDSTLSINDTTYTDININTKDFQYFYRVDIYNLTNGTRDLIGKSTVASSVYLNLIPSDNQLTLVWNENVPWTNTQHIIYRQNSITLIYDSLDITTANQYIDTGLANGSTYCYKVKSIGNYSSPEIKSPLLNYSQETCGQPIDNVPPCPPVLNVDADCDLRQNELKWYNLTNGCADDVLGYKIYKKDSLEDDYRLIATINNNFINSFTESDLFSIAGCYVITSIDSVGNESVFSDSVCVDNCPEYVLPNVFTPGGDGFNDLFGPFPYRFVKSIDIKIFNRWGQVLFKTTDPDINWDGTNENNNAEVPDGTYFYVCTVNEIFLEGIKPRTLKGFVTLLRNKGIKKP